MPEFIGPLTAEEWCSLRLGGPDDPLQCCADTSAVRDAAFHALRMGGGEEHGGALRAAWPRFAGGHGAPVYTAHPLLGKLHAFYVEGKPPVPTDEEVDEWVAGLRIRTELERIAQWIEDDAVDADEPVRQFAASVAARIHERGRPATGGDIGP